MTESTKSLGEILNLVNANLGSVSISGIEGPLVDLVGANWLVNGSEPKCLLMCFSSVKSARKSYNAFQKSFGQKESGLSSAFWPEVDYWGPQRYQNPTEDMAFRLECISKIHSEDSLVIFTTPVGLISRTISTAQYLDSRILLSLEQEVDVDELASGLKALGYQRSGKVEEKGYFAIRGGLIDIFPAGYKHPVRLELLGDLVSSIRVFSAETQRSIKALEQITLAATSECIISEESISDYAQKIHDYLIENRIEKYERQGILEAFRARSIFPGYHKLSPVYRGEDSTLFDHLSLKADIGFFDLTDGNEISSKIEEFKDDCLGYFDEQVENQKLTINPNKHYAFDFGYQKKINDLSTNVKVGLSQNTNDKRFIQSPPTSEINKNRLSNSEDRLNLFEKFLSKTKKITRVFVCESDRRRDKLEAILTQRNLTYRGLDNMGHLHPSQTNDGEMIVVNGVIEKDYYFESDDLHLIPMAYFWGRLESKSTKDKRLRNYLKSFKDLRKDDLVVHVQYGVGKFLEVRQMVIGDQVSDFLVVEYAGGDKVFVPVDKVTLLQRYTPSATGKAAVPLDRLTGSAWENRKNKVRKAVEIMAEELLSIHAKRAIAKTKRYGPMTSDFSAFTDDFPYEETTDQLKVIQDIEGDFVSDKPMDRLIIGDVGFGKTEVALRAAFRAVLEGYQVMVLAPTTVLCHQHFQTFNNRMSKYGVRVKPVNRFVTAKSIKEAKNEWATGRVDVLVGTHRLLNKQFKPKKLGLLIVDEEQRFGVGHKERIKELKTNAGILTMSATPIPRTLHMSMLGLRDISLIATPPENRVAIKNFAINFDEQLIGSAVDHELRRGGQVFIVHNRVEDIAEVANFISRACGGVEVRVGHGQQKEVELEGTIRDFLDKKFPILVCTTIIESGIDMPNVNTILINNAHHFGLSQLYQIRGRVGRSSVQAYAYFITPPVERLTEDARKRIQVIMSHQDLGSGFQIASHDMEIRGAGSVLGEKQSGHISTVGMELYTKMLDEAIKRVKGEAIVEDIDPELKFKGSAIIPQNFIEDQTARVSMYKQIFSLESSDEIYRFYDDVIDQYGNVPCEFDRLIMIAIIKLRLKNLRAASLVQRSSIMFELKFLALGKENIKRVLDLVGSDPAAFRLLPDYRLQIFVDDSTDGDHLKKLLTYLERLSL